MSALPFGFRTGLWRDRKIFWSKLLLRGNLIKVRLHVVQYALTFQR